MTPEQRLEERPGYCPFCGAECAEYCKHLLWSFPEEDYGEDEDEEVPGPTEEFELACDRLSEAIHEGGNPKKVKARLKKLEALSRGKDARGWSWVLQLVTEEPTDEEDEDDEWTDEEDEDEEPRVGRAKGLVEVLLDQVPGVLFTSPDDAESGIGWHYGLYWAEDTESATRTLVDLMNAFTGEVKKVTQDVPSW
jgi:hypothetical protein